MDQTSYCWWLHGWAEINGGGAPTSTQWAIILDHLALVQTEQAAERAPSALAAPRVDESSHWGGGPILKRSRVSIPPDQDPGLRGYVLC